MLILLFGCHALERAAIQIVEAGGYRAPVGALAPVFDGPDAARPRIDVRLTPVAGGLAQVTDLQPIPGDPHRLAVVEKEGQVSFLDLTTGGVAPWFRVEVLTVSEQGLLGLAHHPKFAENGRFFLNLTPEGQGGDTQVVEWQAQPTPRPVRVLITLRQPYQNHNAGQLAFGPDGKLYVGTGDGGFRDDPDRAGQDMQSLLGKMLRLDVDAPPPHVPEDNPFVGDPDVRDEIFALGLRNPWRYSFAPDGRLIVADVGQNTWEEVDIVAAGANLGWSVREGPACFRPRVDCPDDGFTAPVHAYGRDLGSSITGGYVGRDGRYVFGDFVSGRIWSLDLDDGTVFAMGRWPILISTFGRGADGAMYVADYGRGGVYRLDPAIPATQPTPDEP